MTNPEFHRFAQQADEVARIAATVGFPLPKAFTAAKAVADAAQAILNSPPPQPPATPTNPKAVPGWCDDVAASRQTHRLRVEVARDLLSSQLQQTVAAVHDCAPAIVNKIADDANEKLVPRFMTLAETAPREFSAYLDDAQLAAHKEMLRVADELTIAAAFRATLAHFSGESEDLGQQGWVFLFCDPQPAAPMSAVRTEVTRTQVARRSLEDWLHLVAVGLRFARFDEAGPRWRRFTELLASGGNTPDGGIRDRTIGELTVLRDQAALAGAR